MKTTFRHHNEPEDSIIPEDSAGLGNGFGWGDRDEDGWCEGYGDGMGKDDDTGIGWGTGDGSNRELL